MAQETSLFGHSIVVIICWGSHANKRAGGHGAAHARHPGLQGGHRLLIELHSAFYLQQLVAVGLGHSLGLVSWDTFKKLRSVFGHALGMF